MLNRDNIAMGAGAVLAVALLAYVAWRRYGEDAVQALNPLNPGNIFASTADQVVQNVTGDPAQTLGGAIFDYFNPRAGLAEGEALLAPGVIAAPPVPQETEFDALLRELGFIAA